MSGSAHLTSTAAVQDFRGALQEYEVQAREAVEQLLLEMRRGLDWVEHDRAQYWRAETLKASDRLQEARHDLERCEQAIRAQDRRGCHEQRLALEHAKRRLRSAEEKVRAVRRWQVVIRREADSLHSRLLKLLDHLDTEFPRGLASLGRILAALERYTQHSGADSPRGQSAAEAAGTEENPP